MDDLSTTTTMSFGPVVAPMYLQRYSAGRVKDIDTASSPWSPSRVVTDTVIQQFVAALDSTITGIGGITSGVSMQSRNKLPTIVVWIGSSDVFQLPVDANALFELIAQIIRICIWRSCED